MIRKTLAAAFAFSLTTFAGEWRYWTWPGQARMSTIVDRTAWFATSGGVFEWNLDENTSKLHQRSDGLPNTDIVSVARQKDGSIWAVCSDGHLAVKRPTESSWQSKGTFSAEPSPWSFNARVVAMHRSSSTGREVLILGGAQGLAFFPTDSNTTLDWIDQFPSLGKREVRAITLIEDTLWVGVLGGMLRIVPPWDSLGNNRAFVSDPKRWSVLAQTEVTDDYSALFPTSIGMSWQPEYTWASKTALVNQGNLIWNTTAFANTPSPDVYGNNWIYPVHALDNGNELLVSSSFAASSASFNGYSKGPILITKDGTFQYPPSPSNSMPTPPPPAVVLQPGMKLTAWSSTQVQTWSRSQPSWTQPWNDSFASSVSIMANFDLTDNVDMNTFVQGADGSLWAGSWGQGLWGAIPSSEGNDSLVWKTWNSSNSCIEGAGTGDLASYTTINALTTNNSSVWGVTYRLAADSATIFSLPLDGSDIHCWKYPSSNVYNGSIIVLPNRLWLATRGGLRSFDIPSIQSTTLSQISRFSGEYRGAGTIALGSETYVVGMTSSSLSLFSSRAQKDTLLASSTTQPSPLNPRQEWKKMAVDGLGQIWLAGIEGIDIVAVAATPDGYEFSIVREITANDGLPSDLVYNLSIDPSSGMALVATDKGLGLWSSPYRPLADALESKKARVYPNPLRTRTHSELVADGATATSHLYLHAADGSLVVHLPPSEQSGGYFRWKLPSTDKLRPGVYRWTLKDDNSKVGGPLLIAE